MQGCLAANSVTFFQMYTITLTLATAVWSSCSLWLSRCSVRFYTPTVEGLLLQAVFLRERRLYGRSQWPRILRRRYAAAYLLLFWVRILPVLMNICLFVLCIVRKRSLLLADHSSTVLPIAKCFIECDCEASIKRRPWPTNGCRAMGRKPLWENVWSTMEWFLQSRPIIDKQKLVSEPHDVSH